MERSGPRFHSLSVVKMMTGWVGYSIHDAKSEPGNETCGILGFQSME